MQKLSPIILAIESSCDETAAAVINGGKIASNVVATQSIHQRYGGIVPELASRAHQQHIIPVVTQAMEDANVQAAQLDAVAFTQGPGLLGALLVGASFAKSMAFALGIPLIGVHHMRAHLLANFIEQPQPKFPFLGLTLSGGHTQFVWCQDCLTMKVIGTTQDDAIGEAFDKIGKLIGLPYPAGPHIDRYAQQGDPCRFQFPATDMPDLDFSFSGIKTAVRYFVQEHVDQDPEFVVKHREDLCASIQATLVNMVLEKLKKAVQTTGCMTIALAGGVAANTGLRAALSRLAQQNDWQVFVPPLAYCTDNAAMIAMSAHYQYLASDFCAWDVASFPRMPL